MGLFLFPFTYPVTIEKNEIEQTVIIRAIVRKLTKIEMKFVIEIHSNFTIVVENITFKSPLPIKFLMQAIFKKQHAQLFKNIENDKVS